jgi:hypothetical protein
VADEAIVPDEEKRDGRFYRLTELVAAILLSIAALLTSYAGFQGELWDGEQAANYALAEQTRIDASTDEMITGQHNGVDAMIFTQWLGAYTSNKGELEEFYRNRFRPEFKAIFEQWIATRPLANPKAPPTPFHMPGYLDQSTRDAKATRVKADQYFAAGQRANEISDTYGQATVIFALSLFMGGITQTFDTRKTRILLLSLSAFCTLLGVVRIIGLPAIRLY